MTPAVKQTLQLAAASRNKTLTEFLLDSGLNAAADALADGRIFQVDDTQWKAFQTALDNPPEDNPKLRRLLRRRPAWEK
jgi:uncharacterized protein (DUF1778 family)